MARRVTRTQQGVQSNAITELGCKLRLLARLLAWIAGKKSAHAFLSHIGWNMIAERVVHRTTKKRASHPQIPKRERHEFIDKCATTTIVTSLTESPMRLTGDMQAFFETKSHEIQRVWCDTCIGHESARYQAERHVPQVQVVPRTVEFLWNQILFRFIVRVVDVPAVARRQFQRVHKTALAPQAQYVDGAVDVPVVQ